LTARIGQDIAARMPQGSQKLPGKHDGVITANIIEAHIEPATLGVDS
jgi:hypothetical protein